MSDIPPRTCVRCGGLAVCTSWLAQTYDGMPSGREYEFKCSACSHTFRVLGNGQILWSVIAVAGFGWFGVMNLQDALSPLHELWPRTFALGLFCAAAAVTAALQLGWRLHIRASAAELRDQ
jgi:hypothetical protein